MIGSWARFIIGIVLSAGIIWSAMSGEDLGGLLLSFSVLYIVLAVGWFAKKAIVGF